MNNKPLRVLFLGDIVGVPGRTMFKKHIDSLRQENEIDVVLVNGENSASSGKGITPKIMRFFKQHGVSVVTTGNHIWACRDIYDYFLTNDDLLRPANFPGDCPGSGVTTFTHKGLTIAVINVQGRIFMREHLSCPFRAVESLLSYLKSRTNIILVDVHAEATSEKMGLGFFLDGKVSAVVGTHTHIQTTDNRVLPGGTAYISDLGMSGALNSMIGMQKEPIIHNFLTQMPVKFMVEQEGPMILSGVYIDIETSTGKALAIERIRIVDDALAFDGSID